MQPYKNVRITTQHTTRIQAEQPGHKLVAKSHRHAAGTVEAPAPDAPTETTRPRPGAASRPSHLTALGQSQIPQSGITTRKKSRQRTTYRSRTAFAHRFPPYTRVTVFLGLDMRIKSFGRPLEMPWSLVLVSPHRAEQPAFLTYWTTSFPPGVFTFRTRLLSVAYGFRRRSVTRASGMVTGAEDPVAGRNEGSG